MWADCWRVIHKVFDPKENRNYKANRLSVYIEINFLHYGYKTPSYWANGIKLWTSSPFSFSFIDKGKNTLLLILWGGNLSMKLILLFKELTEECRLHGCMWLGFFIVHILQTNLRYFRGVSRELLRCKIFSKQTRKLVAVNELSPEYR